MVGITPAQVWGTFVVAQSLGYLLFTFSPTQHRGPNKCDGRIYPGPFWPCTSHSMMWQIEYGIMAQRYKGAACNLSQKRRSWYLAKYRRANPKKGRSWYLRSTDGQTPKRKELIFDKRTNGQISEWKELIFNKDTEEKSQPIRKEPMRATSVGKGKNRSSNTNDPQIIIIGPLRN